MRHSWSGTPVSRCASTLTPTSCSMTSSNMVPSEHRPWALLAFPSSPPNAPVTLVSRKTAIPATSAVANHLFISNLLQTEGRILPARSKKGPELHTRSFARGRRTSLVTELGLPAAAGGQTDQAGSEDPSGLGIAQDAGGGLGPPEVANGR